MNKIQGIYAAALSVFNDDLSLNVDLTVKHANFLIKNGCHGVVLLGSTGQSQLISIGEKIRLINSVAVNKNYKKFIIGTGLNSLNDTTNLMHIAVSQNLKYFLIMPPAYYNYSDKDVINYFAKIFERIDNCKVILYNYEKLCGYKFSVECIKQLKDQFPKQIIGVKDSTGNIFNKIKLNNFAVLLGTEENLMNSLKMGCHGVISATCNVTSYIARKVYDDFNNDKNSSLNEKLSLIRKAFNNFDLVSGLHTYLSKKDPKFKNVLPILDLLNKNQEKKLFEELDKLDFNINYLNL
tara:strand:- start:781 stop:1662 length:882 start_codon:yes stop_codon:yes gene_type:complete